MSTQIVVSGNRVLAHGEDCFNAFGNGVFCSKTGRTFENATAVNVENIPADIDSVGYEYHAGTFVPCAPFSGIGNGNLAVLCEGACRAIKDSGVSLNHLKSLKRTHVFTYVGNGQDNIPLSTYIDFTPQALMIIPSSGTSGTSAVMIRDNGISFKNGTITLFSCTATTGYVGTMYELNSSNKTYNAIAFE